MSRHPGTFIGGLLFAAVLGSLFDLGAEVNAFLSDAIKVAVALIFFAYGARLSPSQTLDGLRNWRLHTAILMATFVIFPLLGLVIDTLSFSDSPFLIGLLFLTALPSTVQAAVTAVSIARGNTAAAVISASASNLIGVFLTPILVAILIGEFAQDEVGTSLLRVFGLLMVPFILGQFSRPLTSQAAKRAGPYVDRIGIMFTVFVAFAAGRHGDVWSTITPSNFVLVFVGCFVLLISAATIIWAWAKLWRFNRQDAITVVFCGSQKALSTGLPMATIIFEPTVVPFVVVPVMVYHQFQIIGFASIASRLARRNAIA